MLKRYLAAAAVVPLALLGLAGCVSLPGLPIPTSGGGTPSTTSSPSSPSTPSTPGGGTQTSKPSSPSSGDWPSTVIDNYLESCKQSSGGQVAYCECTLEILQSLYTLDQFSKLEQDMLTDPSVLKDVQAKIISCASELK